MACSWARYRSYAQGKTLDELMENMRAAVLRSYIHFRHRRKTFAPQPMSR